MAPLPLAPALRVMALPEVSVELSETMPVVALAVMAVVADKAGLTVTLPAEEVIVIVLAASGPPDMVRLPEDDSVIVPILPEPPYGVRLPVRFKLPLFTASAKLEPLALPAEELLNETAAAVSLPMLTLPLEFSESVLALSVFAPE